MTHRRRRGPRVCPRPRADGQRRANWSTYAAAACFAHGGRIPDLRRSELADIEADLAVEAVADLERMARTLAALSERPSPLRVAADRLADPMDRAGSGGPMEPSPVID